MITKTYKKEDLTAYLLGNLPEPDAERFDELSFTDDDFADQLNSAENDLIDAYVTGELGGENLEKFESFYLASPLRREKVKFAGAFQDFAKERTAEFQTEKEEAEKNGFFSKLFARPGLAVQWSFALAAVLVVIFGGFMIWQNQSLRDDLSRNPANRDEISKPESVEGGAVPEKRIEEEIKSERDRNSEAEKELARVREEREKLEQAQKIKQKRENEQLAAAQKPTPSPEKRQPSVLAFVLAPTLRGTNQPQSLKIPPETRAVSITLELEANDYDFYRVALRNPAGGRILWQSGKISSRAGNNSLNVNFPANLLESKVYSLEVSGILKDNAAEIISDYSFRAVR